MHHDDEIRDYHAKPPLVLVVDDNEEPRRAIRTMFEHCFGAKVIEAESSHQALDLAAQNDFDLCTSDLARAPMNGYNFLPAFKTIRPNVPVIIISAVLHLGDAKEQVRALGASGCLDKPFTLQEFIDVIDGVANWRRSSES